LKPNLDLRLQAELLNRLLDDDSLGPVAADNELNPYAVKLLEAQSGYETEKKLE
jgi:hypothetical protein